MDEKLIDQLYSEAVARGYKKGKGDFVSLLKSDDMAYEDMYSFAQSKGLVSDATQFGSMVGRFQAPYKKKEEPALGLPEQMFQTKPQAKPEPQLRMSPTPVGRGARRMAAEPATALPSEAGLSVSQGIEQPLKPSVGVVAESTAMPKIDVKAIQEQKAYEKKIADETPKEVPYFTGTVGTVLSAIDSPYSPVGQVGVGDFIDDMGRAIASGLNQGDITTPANVLLLTGKNSSPDQIKKYIAAVKDYEKIGASEEMIKFSKTYQDEGKTVYGFLKGLAENPGVIGELIVSSATAMLNPSSLAAAGAVTGGFAAAGAAGAAPGAAAGALSSIPWAIGAAGTALETGLTFSELLKERLQERNLEFTEENVKTILEDEKALNDIRTKSLARGATIGAVDALTGRLAGKVGAKLLGNTPASRVKAGLAGAGIEMVGGSVGEAAGRVVAGQELDVAEIGLEGIAEGPMAIADVTAEVLRRPIYKVNGERRNESDIESIISTASPEDLYKIDIDIKNDVKGYRKRIQDIIVDDQMRKEIRQANPNVDDATINTLLGLEKELKTFENNKTQSGKDRAAAIRSQIKTIQQDAVQKQAAGEVPVQPRAGVSQEMAEGIPQPKPEGVTAEGVQETIAPEVAEEEVAVSLTTPKEVEAALISLPEEKKMEEIDGDIPIAGNETIIAKQYIQAKQDNSNPKLVENVEKIINENLPTQRVQVQPGTIQQIPQAAVKPTGLPVPSQPSPKREEIKSSIKRIANAGILRSAETGQPAITEQEIDAQMALTDAMARVWEETTGNNNFYETFFQDVKEGDVEAIKQKGGALFQNIELPQRPITRVSLGVFELPEFQKMKGSMVSPQSVGDLMKSRGKQIEKDIVNSVLGYDKYKGQKRILFDEFKDDVETQLMKLERIDTKTYSSYGKDNLGDSHEYGSSQTIIFNSPIDHGQHGHFSSDFNKGNLAPQTWEIRQIPNTEQYVAIDANMPPNVSQAEMSGYIGTAGPKADVERWIADRNSISDKEINKGLFGHIRNWFNANTGVYTLAELQSDYFQKNKANDLYASKISADEVNEYMNKNFNSKLDQETVNILKKEFDIEVIKKVLEDGTTVFSAFKSSHPEFILQEVSFSDSYIPVIGYTLDQKGEHEVVVGATRFLANVDEKYKIKRNPIIEEYHTKKHALKAEENKYISKKIEEIKKSQDGNLMLKQFVASQKVHELRLFRESLKHAADKGAKELWFPTPYTIAVIEGYVSSTGNAPYEVISGSEARLEPGDVIDYGGRDMIVVDASNFSITVAPKDEVSVFDIDSYRDDEIRNRMDELEYDLERQVNDINAITREEAKEYNSDEFLSKDVKIIFLEWFGQNPEEEVVRWSDIEDKVRDSVGNYYYNLYAEDLIGWASEIYLDGDTVYAIENRRSTERFGQPSEYDAQVDESNFEDELSDEQLTVVKKYEELGDMIRKMRPDAGVVTDNNGKQWISTSITEADASNPIIAFQEEGGKAKGAIDFSNDNKASIYIFNGADISTLAHEMSGHLGRRVLEKLSATDKQFAKDYEKAKKWAGVKDNQWTRSAEEKWARGFEKYLRTGKAPSSSLKNVFQKLQNWLTNIYKTIKGSSIDIDLTPEIISVFDNLLATKSERAVVQKEKTTPSTVEDQVGKPVNELPGYDKLMDDVTNTLIPNALRRKLTGEEMIKMVKKFVAKSDIYKAADDIQRDELVRQVNGMLGEAYKNAPSAQKILGIKKTKVEVSDELKALNDQLKLEAKAAREAKADLNTKRKQLMDAVRKMADGGKISARNVSALLNKIGNLNLDSQTAVKKFTDYASKVFADADYADKLNTANSTRKKIRKVSKDTDKSANLRTLGGKFSEIDPSMVDDIDTYNEIAAKVLESIKGSSIRGTDVKFAGIVSEADTMNYINNTLDEQQKKMFDQKVEEIKELLGVDVSGLTYDQIMEMVQGTEPVTKYNETIIRDAIRKAFDIYSTLIRESIATGKDPMTGDKVSFTDTQKKTINAFMNMDLDLLNAREALNAVDSLVNFIQNGSTAKMDAVVSEYTGKKNIRTLANRGVKASPIKKYWSPALGKFLAEQVTNLNVLFERMFKGVTRGGMVEDMSGVTALKNGKSNAQSEANRIVEEYVDKFYKKQANFGDFNTSYNNIERGMASFLTRNIVGTDAEMKAEFERRNGLVEQSIEVLSQGNEAEIEKSVLYQDVYNSIASGANTIDDVLKNVDPVNLEAINFWQDKWAGKYDQLADVSLNIYNKVLGRDINFTPDRFTRLSYDTDIVEISNEDMAFHYNNGTPYKKETGVLMEATRPNTLPVNEKSKEVSRYIDLSFDKNNANSMYDALVDIKTAGPIRQVESFLNSPYLKKVVPDSNDAQILKNRINLFVRNIRKKNPYSNDELSSAVRKLNRLAAIGVGQALGGVLQPVKQVIPVAMNTLINANGNLDIASIFDKAKNDFISKSGYAIANRGIESQAQVESLNKLIDEAAKSNIDKAVNLIDKANRWWLKNFLANADVFIARTSWITYYQQSLKNQGIDPSTIDYATHELNEEAANYAQRQVDRQQNVSDSDLAGELLLSNEPIKQIFVKMLMPFSSFRMNQSARLGSDLATLTSNTSTQEDKKIARKSLVGFGVENLMFKAISAGSILLTSAIVSSIMGDEEDEKEKQKKKDMIVKGQLTSTATDLFSPLPFIDPLVQMGASFAMDKVQQAMDIPDDQKLSIYSGTKEDFIKSLGLLGIAVDRATQLFELSDLAYNGKFEDKYGKEKLVTPENRETLKYLIGPAILTNIGLAPTEVNSVIRGAIRNAKLNAANPVDSDKQMMKILLQGYESKSDMERYDPKLYEETFGEKGIEQYVLPLNVIEREINKEMNKAERDIKDRIYNYKPKEKGEGGFGSSKFGE